MVVWLIAVACLAGVPGVEGSTRAGDGERPAVASRDPAVGERYPGTELDWPAGRRRVGELVNELSSVSGFPYVVSAELGAPWLDRQIRVPTFRGAAFQAALLLGELGQADVLFLEGVMVWLPRRASPASLELAQESELDDYLASKGLCSEDLLGRWAAVRCEEATLSFAASAVARAYEIPVVLSGDTRATQVLVSLDGMEWSLAEVLRHLAESCGVHSTIRAGMVWWSAGTRGPADPAGADGTQATTEILRRHAGLGVSMGRPCVAAGVGAPRGGEWEAVDAVDPAADILEAHRLAGRNREAVPEGPGEGFSAKPAGSNGAGKRP